MEQDYRQGRREPATVWGVHQRSSRLRRLEPFAVMYHRTSIRDAGPGSGGGGKGTPRAAQNRGALTDAPVSALLSRVLTPRRFPRRLVGVTAPVETSDRSKKPPARPKVSSPGPIVTASRRHKLTHLPSALPGREVCPRVRTDRRRLGMHRRPLGRRRGCDGLAAYLGRGGGGS